MDSPLKRKIPIWKIWYKDPTLLSIEEQVKAEEIAFKRSQSIANSKGSFKLAEYLEPRDPRLKRKVYFVDDITRYRRLRTLIRREKIRIAKAIVKEFAIVPTEAQVRLLLGYLERRLFSYKGLTYLNKHRTTRLVRLKKAFSVIELYYYDMAQQEYFDLADNSDIVFILGAYKDEVPISGEVEVEITGF